VRHFGQTKLSGNKTTGAIMKMTKAGQKKVGKVMGEYKEGTLHSGKDGKVVKNPKQAVAIALSSAKKVMKKSK
jgi:hypothetical protein